MTEENIDTRGQNVRKKNMKHTSIMIESISNNRWKE